jgi:hypothetical protein
MFLSLHIDQSMMNISLRFSSFSCRIWSTTSWADPGSATYHIPALVSILSIYSLPAYISKRGDHHPRQSNCIPGIWCQSSYLASQGFFSMDDCYELVSR